MEQRHGVVSIVGVFLQLSLDQCEHISVNTGLYCQKPSPPRNGSVQLTEDWLRNTMAIFKCDPGHILVGSKVLYCLGSSWNDTEPMCAVKDCLAHYKAGSVKDGIYGVIPYGTTPRLVYCDMTTAGGGWTVFPRRINNFTDFNQDWGNYKYGFGEVEGNFWLGLETLHHIANEDSELYIHMEADHGDSRYARYGTFNIGGERDNFRLTVENYTGNAGDSLIRIHNRQIFSTKDKGSKCAGQRQAAWWYKSCDMSNLNGLYLNGKYTGMSDMGIVWDTYKGGQYSLKYVKMMTRRTGAS